MQSVLLTLTTFLPLFGAMVMLFLPKEEETNLKWWAFLISAITFVVSLPLLFQFEIQNGGMQFIEYYPWIPSFGVSYHLGIDGISLFLVIMTTAFSPFVILSTFSAIHHRMKEFFILLLVLESGMIGVFVSLDLFLFYVFWEVMLVPMYFLIGIWGGDNRIYASVKFFLYTLIGSLFMLLAIIYLAISSSKGNAAFDFNLLSLMNKPLYDTQIQIWLFLAFAVSFAIKVPLFPFHTWLPDAHVQAPTAGSVVLAAVLLKMGTYGFLRFAIPLFPQATEIFMPALATLAVIGIIYGAMLAFVQHDIKKLVAYSSISHLGVVVLGIASLTTESLTGSVYQMLGHGVTTGALFLLIGMIYERRHTRELSEFGGLAKQLPMYATCFVIIVLGSAGVPGFVGFIGEFLILSGTFLAPSSVQVFEHFSYFSLLSAISVSGVILSAVYLLKLVQKMFFGPLSQEKNQNLLDLSFREKTVLLPFLVLTIIMGLAPSYFTQRIEPSIRHLVNTHQQKLAQGASLEKQERLTVSDITKAKLSMK